MRCTPVPLGHTGLGKGDGRGRQHGPPRVPARGPRARVRSRRARRPRAAGHPSVREARAGRGRRRGRKEGVGEPDSDLTRERAVEELAGRRFDLLVIGGGIIGAGIAAHAARAGLAVALVEQGDFGGATSSASSKLIHGGLRYLRLGDLRLVREAHHERRILTKIVAPHLVQPDAVPPASLPRRPLPAGVRPERNRRSTRCSRGRGSTGSWIRLAPRAMVPPLRGDGLRSCALYADATTNDARLCLENVRAAAEAGACVLNGAEVLALRTSHGKVSRRGGSRRRRGHRRSTRASSSTLPGRGSTRCAGWRTRGSARRSG